MAEQLAYDPDDYSKREQESDSDSSSEGNVDDFDDGDTEYAGSSTLSSHGVSVSTHREGLETSMLTAAG